jgi:hypothetical protein
MKNQEPTDAQIKLQCKLDVFEPWFLSLHHESWKMLYKHRLPKLIYSLKMTILTRKTISRSQTQLKITETLQHWFDQKQRRKSGQGIAERQMKRKMKQLIETKRSFMVRSRKRD